MKQDRSSRLASHAAVRNALRVSLAAMLLWTCATAATAQDATPAERARCDGVQQDKAACLREAGAARQEARRDGLTHAGSSSYEHNALARCKQQPEADRADCEARVRGGATSSSKGSVMGGGVIRETVTPVPVPAR